MLSTFSASSSNPLSAFSGGFPSWDCAEFLSSPTTTQYSPTSTSPLMSSSGSDESNQNPQPVNSNSNSGEPDRPVPAVDDRKRRRMISNRESARRSRMRKQKHLENLRNHLNWLRVQNRELTNRLRFVLYHFHCVRTENDDLRSESTMLWQKLSDIQQILLFRQLQQFSPSPAWPCNNFTTTSEQTPSLIT